MPDYAIRIGVRMCWKPITDIPSWEFVELYSPTWAKSEKGQSSKGIVIGCHCPATATRPDEYIDHCSGQVLEMEFTLWRALEIPQVTTIPEPPLTGHWHHGNGIIVSGGARIARADFDGMPPVTFTQSLFDWVCVTLNQAVDAWYATRNEDKQ